MVCARANPAKENHARHSVQARRRRGRRVGRGRWRSDRKCRDVGEPVVFVIGTGGRPVEDAQGQPQRNPSQAGHTVNGKTEELLSGDVASKVRAAALAKVPGTVERVETNVDSSAPYEAHIRKSDGTQVEVQVGSDYTVSAVNEMGGPHP
jgi:hypothetical protein